MKLVFMASLASSRCHFGSRMKGVNLKRWVSLRCGSLDRSDLILIERGQHIIS